MKNSMILSEKKEAGIKKKMSEKVLDVCLVVGKGRKNLKREMF